MQALIDFYNSPNGRKLINWGITTLGLLIQGGLIPLDIPIPGTGISSGVLLTILGARLPSVSPQGPSAVVPTVKGTGDKL